MWETITWITYYYGHLKKEVAYDFLARKYPAPLLLFFSSSSFLSFSVARWWGSFFLFLASQAMFCLPWLSYGLVNESYYVLIFKQINSLREVLNNSRNEIRYLISNTNWCMTIWSKNSRNVNVNWILTEKVIIVKTSAMECRKRSSFVCLTLQQRQSF